MIHGIQQIGIGVMDLHSQWRWYRQAFSMDVPIFQEEAEAPYMTAYTGGEVQSRNAVLAANLQGGSAFEIWQFTSRAPTPQPDIPRIGDLGIIAARIKTVKVETAFNHLKSLGTENQAEPPREVFPPSKDPVGNNQCYCIDPYGNIFHIARAHDWFGKPKTPTGGAAGCMIGVSDIDRVLPLYREVFGYDFFLYDKTGVFPDFRPLPGGDRKVRRVLITHSKPRTGAFSRLLGNSAIELIQLLDGTPRRLYKDRFWGDPGFIHLCFDVTGMDGLKEACAKKGFPFTVDTGSTFDMGEAGGRFAYLEDPDGNLIEFVETHKMPILKKLGWYLHLDKRDPEKPLPDFMLKLLALSRVRD